VSALPCYFGTSSQNLRRSKHLKEIILPSRIVFRVIIRNGLNGLNGSSKHVFLLLSPLMLEAVIVTLRKGDTGRGG
jgi:hypothetical protein